jgi:hypothetical protein
MLNIAYEVCRQSKGNRSVEDHHFFAVAFLVPPLPPPPLPSARIQFNIYIPATHGKTLRGKEGAGGGLGPNGKTSKQRIMRFTNFVPFASKPSDSTSRQVHFLLRKILNGITRRDIS